MRSLNENNDLYSQHFNDDIHHIENYVHMMSTIIISKTTTCKTAPSLRMSRQLFAGDVAIFQPIENRRKINRIIMRITGRCDSPTKTVRNG